VILAVKNPLSAYNAVLLHIWRIRLNTHDRSWGVTMLLAKFGQDLQKKCIS